MIRKLKPKSEFSRNVLTLMTGTTIAQAIPIAISPILTRIYSPKEFGIFALYTSIASIIALIAGGRYEQAIMLPKKEGDAMNILVLSTVLSIIVSLVSLIIVSVFNTQITNLLGNPEISNWLYFIPLTVLLTGMYQSFNYWSNRKKHYKRLATSRVVQSTTAASTNLALGFGGFGSSGLIMGFIAGQGMSMLMLGKGIWKEDKKLGERVHRLKITALAKKYSKFPKFNLPNALIDNIRISGINILIAKFFTTGVLGQFSLAWRMVQAPMMLIGSSLTQVFFQKIATAQKNDLERIIKKFMVKAAIVAAPIFMIIYLFAEDIFALVFGNNWKVAGEAASIMAPWLFLNFLTSPLSTIFIVLNRQELVLAFSTVYMMVPLGLLFTFNHLDFLELLGIVTFLMSMMLVLFILMVFVVIRANRTTVSMD
ncbi:MAG: oligosaccharide flippase family protein [Campylobacterales bacterium]|nr:oligosaccharide flippase family protein [Campylobacterales bacterium]